MRATARTIYFILIVAFATSVASPDASAQWRGLLQVGVTGSTLSGDADSDFSSVARLSGGGGLSYLNLHGFLIEPGLHYTSKGANADGELDGVPIEATFDLVYLEIPFFFGYVMERSGRIHPKIFGGPVLAFNLDSTVTFRAKAGGPEFQEADDTVEGRDLGLGVGIGAEIDIGDERLMVGVQGTFGMSNARTVQPELRNRSFSFFTGIIF